MAEPDIIKGKVVGYDKEKHILKIVAKYDDVSTLTKLQIKDCTIQLVDGRKLSGRQRNLCYRLMRDIANFSGESVDEIKNAMKERFAEAENVSPKFSLSDASMTLIRGFQRFLIQFMLDMDIPTSVPLLEFADDVESFIYGCLKTKKCCICGRRADLHHVSRVGMGRNRDEIIHEGMEALPLCREHHIEVDQLGDKEFNAKYHITQGVILDKGLCRLYGLKRRIESAE